MEEFSKGKIGLEILSVPWNSGRRQNKKKCFHFGFFDFGKSLFKGMSDINSIRFATTYPAGPAQFMRSTFLNLRAGGWKMNNIPG
jgi:hypothetical protein